MNTRELEKLARSLHAQKLDLAYIRHYLSETYQVDDKTIDYVFMRTGLDKLSKKGKPGSMSKARPAVPKSH